MKNVQVTLSLFVIALLTSQVSAQGARYIERQLLCALDQAPCDAWGAQIKGALPEIIGRRCQNCDRSQVNNVRRIASFVQTRYPGLWAAIVEKYSKTEDERNEEIAYNTRNFARRNVEVLHENERVPLINPNKAVRYGESKSSGDHGNNNEKLYERD